MLLLPVLVTAGLGAAYLNALTARQRAIEAAGTQYARRVAETALALAEARGTVAARALLDPARRLAHPTLDGLVAVMVRARDSLRRCGCGPIKEGKYLFAWVPSSGEFASSGLVALEDDPRLRLSAVSGGLDESVHVYAPEGDSPAGPWLVQIAAARVDGRLAVVGFDVAMASWWRDTFVPALADAGRQFFAAVPSSDSAFTARLWYQSLPVAGREAPVRGPRSLVRVHPASNFELEVVLNPAVLPVLLAAAGPPSYSLLIGAMAASVALSAMALLLLRQVRRTMLQREAFTASVSHELRTPLTELLLHAESLSLDRRTPEAKARAVDAIVRETRRLISLVENILGVAGAARRAPPESVSLGPLVREIIGRLEPLARDHQAAIEARLDDGVRAAVDPVSIDRILTNLIENALRYGPAGQTVAVALTRRDEAVELEVTDDGPGIPEVDRDRVFRPFERAGAGRQHGPGGLGLGLAIVRHLAEAAGGRVSIGDADGGGARVTVTIPAADSLGLTPVAVTR
ncbi:MAG: HAMP domain-containing sensor histidine kinase [Gemmatimonadales bacterium]